MPAGRIVDRFGAHRMSIAGLIGIAVVGAAVAGGGNQLDLSGFRLSMAITAVLVAAGGVIGFAGIRNRPLE